MKNKQMQKVLNRLQRELTNTVTSIWSNPRYRSDKKKIYRTVDAWKDVVNRYMMNTDDPYIMNGLWAVLNAVNYHVYDMEPKEAQYFITKVIERIGE